MHYSRATICEPEQFGLATCWAVKPELSHILTEVCWSQRYQWLIYWTLMPGHLNLGRGSNCRMDPDIIVKKEKIWNFLKQGWACNQRWALTRQSMELITFVTIRRCQWLILHLSQSGGVNDWSYIYHSQEVSMTDQLTICVTVRRYQ